MLTHRHHRLAPAERAARVTPAGPLGLVGLPSVPGVTVPPGRPEQALTQLTNLKKREALDYYARARIDARIDELLALVGLPPQAARQFPESLSGGMVKRAALARALALDPDILFLDEPTAGLDPIGAAAFDQLLVTLRDALGFSVFLVTHDLDTLYAACDRVAVLSQKRVLVADTLEKVAQTDDEWIQDYFNGPRGRAAQRSAEPTSREE